MLFRVILFLLMLAGVGDDAAAEPVSDEPRGAGASSAAAGPPGIGPGRIVPLPRAHGLDPRKIALGRRLFHDRRLSRDNSVSCASCHDLSGGGDDGRARSRGIDGGVGGINAPTVLNSGYNFVQFWDGRAASLEAQVEGPLHHPKELASNWSQVLAKLGRDESYTAAFQDIYGGSPSAARVKDAIATFERALVTPDSPFDRFLRGDDDALSPAAVAGYEKFQRYGCIACHQGRGVGGNMFAKFGVMADYFAARGDLRKADYGRYNVTGRERDRHVFKVPSLRNVALTPPYMHDGSATTLAEAVNVMAAYQLGLQLPAGDVDEIVAFLESLTGEFVPEPQP